MIDLLRPEKLNNARILSWFSLKNPEYHAESASIDGLNVGFSSEEDQHVILGNIHYLCTEIGINHRDLAIANQIHSSNVMQVKKGGVYPNVDAFVCNTPGVTLGIQVADCGAVLLGDFKNKVIGALHAGWRGAVEGIISKTVDEMIKLGAEAQEIKAFISPCLAVENFEVGEEVAENFPEHLIERNGYPKPHVDLKRYIRQELMYKQVLSSNIQMDERCTIDHEEEFYSFRREKDKSGRMMALIKINKL